MRRILHPTDFSRASARAFAKALELAKQNKSELILLHVITPVIPLDAIDAYPDPKTYTALEDLSRRRAEAELERLERKAKQARVKTTKAVLKGAPHAEIVRAAKRYRADLIVLGTHGRTGISKLLMGSVAAKVIALASCPVMTVRGP